MKTKGFLALAAVSAGLLMAGFCAQAHPGSGGDIILTCRPNTPYITTNGGLVYLHFGIKIPHGEAEKRLPLNLSVVIDRSGSMGEDRKMEYAKSALARLIQQLGREDVLSIVMYDDVVELLQPAVRVRDRGEILTLLEQIYPRGSTNLGAGMQEGFEQVRRNTRKGYVNRVILISDGLANTGITDPHDLNRISRRYRGRSISLTTMGVGLSYNENLMVGLAESGGGNYYFIEHPNMLAQVFKDEFNMMSRLCAHDAILEITLHPNAALNDVFGYQSDAANGRHTIHLGDLYYGEERDVTVEIAVGRGTGLLALASGSLQYASANETARRAYEFGSTVTYTEVPAEIEKHRNMDVQAKADVMVSTKKVEEALQALDAGRGDEAEQALQAAKSVLSASPAVMAGGAGAASIATQVDRISRYQSELKDSTGDARKAKKSIQYDNYRTQKTK